MDLERDADSVSDDEEKDNEEVELDEDVEESNAATFDPARKLEARQIAEELNEKVKKSGVLYLSTIPTGMNVAKLREVLSQYGEIGRIYLEPDLKG